MCVILFADEETQDKEEMDLDDSEDLADNTQAFDDSSDMPGWNIFILKQVLRFLNEILLTSFYFDIKIVFFEVAFKVSMNFCVASSGLGFGDRLKWKKRRNSNNFNLKIRTNKRVMIIITVIIILIY